MAFSFIYNELDSLDEGLFVESIPPFPSFEEEDNLYTIIFAYKNDPDDNLRKYMKLKSIFSEEGKLKTSLANDLFLRVDSCIFKEIDKNKSYVVNSVTFKIEPFLYFDNGEDIISITTKPYNIYNSTGISKPRIKVTGSGLGSIVINGITLSVDIIDSYIIIDSMLEEIFSQNGFMTNYVDGPFPIMIKGMNTISFTGGITKIEIIPNWRC